jgi:ankyrin repeat protein
LQRARVRLRERMVSMVRDELHEQRPSCDPQLLQAVRWLTTLRTIADESQLAALEQMLVDGVDIDARDAEGRTMLHWAAQQGNREAAEWLLEHGASLGARDASGRTPQQVASQQGHAALSDRLRHPAGHD